MSLCWIFAFTLTSHLIFSNLGKMQHVYSSWQGTSKRSKCICSADVDLRSYFGIIFIQIPDFRKVKLGILWYHISNVENSAGSSLCPGRKEKSEMLKLAIPKVHSAIHTCLIRANSKVYVFCKFISHSFPQSFSLAD